MKKIISLSCYALFLLPLFSFSQQPSVTPAYFPDDLTFTNIVGMAQDNKGFIWIADNSSGLFKYDGTHIISYKPESNNRNSINTTRLECLYAGKKGNIWIGTFQNGLERFDPETETFTLFQHNNNDLSSICSDSVRALLEEDDGTVWVGSVNGLDRLDIKTGKFTHIGDKSEAGLSLSHDHVRVLYQDKAGTIWVGCGSPFFTEGPKPWQGGLYKLDKAGKITHYQHNEKDSSSLMDNTVRAIFEDSRGVFWVGTGGDGLHIMDREKGSFQRCLNDPHNPNKPSRPPVTNTFTYAEDHITFINEDKQGCIWIGTFSGGINRYNPATGNTEHFGTGEKGPYKTLKNDYWTCLKTKDDLLWASIWQPASNDQPLFRISTTINKLNYSHFGRVAISFAQDADGSMWFGTNQGLLHNKNNSYDSFFVDATKTGLNNFILHLEQDADNNLWLSTFSGLYYFKKTTRNITTYRHDEKNKNSLSSDTVVATQLNGDGTIWVGTSRALDLVDMKTGIFKHYINDPADSTSISSNQIQDIKRDKAGNIWIGTTNGLDLFDKNTGKFKTKIEKRVTIFCIFEDSRERLWIGTSADGLFVYNPKTDNFSRWNDSTGLMNNNPAVFAMTEDKEHSLWLNTSIGFIQLDPETKMAMLFGKSWGINPAISTGFAFTSSQGEIFFGDTAGYYHFLPQNIGISQGGAARQPFISKFFISNKQLIPGTDKVLPESLSQTEKIKLGYYQNNFAIEFNSVDFITNESDKNLLYKLENYDEAWRKNRGENKVYYYNVPPGKYVFRVKAVDLYGRWSERSLTIIITPPWYKTWWAYLLFALLTFGILRGYIVYRSRKLQREKKILEEKVDLRTKQLQHSLDDLKTTQSQLIQSEKMASLGELTAGIAHEIQNPLNFVNNFSEVNSELIAEMKQEIDNGNLDDAKTIANNIDENEQKIIFHGKRADTIVKGMLQHSRSSNGIKEPTDISALADEYLRLAYHGLRAKDKTFNATMKTDYDQGIGNINIIPQDIGRVILNLITNAFYAVGERRKVEGEGYEPTVSVSTMKVGPKVEIKVSDNGGGIPQKVLDKIFQPFFTTKPTG
ncbi:MAG TPA: two-component regulator propeller domain-containing protein, partial [Chitinophagaceae bacterium]|nr:two-component regulator propeller domain-containing protein [Chitinophagaceae bacterium]